MKKELLDKWVINILYYSMNSLSGNPLLKSRCEYELPAIIKSEYDYCLYGLSSEDKNYIISQTSTPVINLVTTEKSCDQRRLAKRIMESHVSSWINCVKILYDSVEYQDIAHFAKIMPFLQQDMNILVDFIEREGLKIKNKPDDLKKGIKKTRKYESEDERKAARKRTRANYQKRKNLENKYSLSQSIAKAEEDPYKYRNEFDDGVYVSRYL